MSSQTRLHYYPSRLSRSCFFQILTTLLFILAVLAASAQAQDGQPDAAVGNADSFAACVVGLKLYAAEQGIPAELAEETLTRASYLPRVIELDRRQPEFTVGFGEYLARRVTEERIRYGRELLNQHRSLLLNLQEIYGIPPQYLLAFWGLETNFGNYLGMIPTISALTTLACDKRRSDFFTEELVNALRLLEKPGIREPLFGSWAGAMGHTQFMPSAYLRYGVDGDGDGEINLWTSVADALTSAANFLHHLGWQTGFRWGREVRLPESFTFDSIGLQSRQPLAAWHQEGIRNAFNGPLPSLSPGTQLQAALLVPSGYRGPAFLVYDNFEVIMRWNHSEFYALAVGILADQINGGPPLQQPPPTDLPRLSTVRIKKMQSRLASLGFAPGEPDGILGPMTREAIRDFQKSRNMVPDGYPREEFFAALDNIVN